MSPIDRLTEELSKLPGIGGKTALRLAIHILRQPSNYAKALSQALLELVEKMTFCRQCYHFTDGDPCGICADPIRDQAMICVVEDSTDLLAINKTREYRGTFHVLQGSLSPLDGIGPDQLRIAELLQRIQNHKPQEIILATNHTVTGDATALYLSKMIKPLEIRLTRLASGIPVGGDIQYLDHRTLSRAMASRIEY